MTKKLKVKLMNRAICVLCALVGFLSIQLVRAIKDKPIYDMYVIDGNLITEIDQEVELIAVGEALELKAIELQEEAEDLFPDVEDSEPVSLDYYKLEALIRTESDGIATAISCRGRDSGIGLMQVSKVALQDYNLWNGTEYTQEDLFNPQLNVMIGTWVFLHNIHYGVPNELSALLTAYNCGAGYYKQNGVREAYIKRFLDKLAEVYSESI